MSSNLRIVFAGTPAFAADHLTALLNQSYHIVGVLTQPDRPAGRGKQLQASPVKRIAEAQSIPVLQPSTLKDDKSLQALNALAPDIIVVVAYGLILPEQVLTLPQFGCINVHASLLPAWRGAAPIHRAIESGDSESGVTIMQMDSGLDTGDMLLSRRTRIRDDHTTGTLTDDLAALGAEALNTVLSDLKHYQSNAVEQPNTGVSYAHKIAKAEAEIDWSQTASTIAKRVLAFNPGPVCFSFLDGERVKIWRGAVHSASVETAALGQCGEIIEAGKSGIFVCCGERTILIIETLQLPGKSPVAAADAVNGNAAFLKVGKRFESRAN